MRVLVVDESSTMRRIIANTLKRLGHEEIIEVRDGTEGLAQLATRPDLVLTAWSMPTMDGHEFVRKLRERPDMATVPLLIVTTHAEKADVVLAAQAGITDYVVKPFTPETLKAKIEAVLGKLAA